MNKPKHTPGPWAVNDMALNYVVHSKNYVQARTDGHSETDLANARLIAAAPELLEALKTAIKKCGGMDDFYYETLALIAKATGGQRGGGAE